MSSQKETPKYSLKRSEDDPPDFWNDNSDTHDIWRAHYWINQYMLIQSKLSKSQIDSIDKNIEQLRKTTHRKINSKDGEISISNSIWEYAYRTRRARDLLEDIF
jgi:hypothetical protein